MRSNPVVVLPVLDVERAQRTIDSLRDDERRGSLVVVDNSPGGLVGCDVWHYRRPGQNLGVAASWNFGASLAVAGDRSHLVVVSEAVEFVDGGEALFGLLDEHPVGFVSHVWWHVAAVSVPVLERVGWFDTGFHPAYFEDTDMERRIALAGLDLPNGLHVPGIVDHGAAHSLTAGLVECDYGAMAERYRRKWGGDPGSETLVVPWGQRP